MKIKIFFFGGIILLSTIFSCTTNRTQPEITTQELKSHEFFLASDSLKGRFPGTREINIAAAYIRDDFKRAGLKLLGDHGFEPFEVVTSIHEGENNHFAFNGEEQTLGAGFAPMSFSSSSTLKAGVVFTGYGFDINEDSLKWNDFSGVDIAGKWVIILRGDPEPDVLDSPFARYSRDRDKAMAAMDHGAGGILLVSGKEFDERDELESLRKIEYSAGIPVIQITRKVADRLLAPSTIEQLEAKLNKTGKPASFALPVTVEATTDIKTDKKTTYNVVGLLEGHDPVLRDQIVVIGAHYDHLGMGGPNTGSRRPDTIAVHYGADDNASGTSLVMELAGKLASQQDSLRRSIIFIAFSAEEMGLLGSKYFTKDTLADMHHIVAMINADMVGRLNEEHKLEIGGTGTTPVADSLLKAIPLADSFKLVLSTEGYGPSDHASFYAQDIPVFFLSTGTHLDYHTPSDTPDKINYPGLKLIGDYIDDLAIELANLENPPVFTKAGPKEGSGFNRRGFKVTLGIMPDYAGEYKNGLRVDLVIPGRPASAAGMQNGDIITAMNGQPVKNIYDYMYRLVKLHPGDRVNVEILRGDTTMILIVQL
ncbi:MAG: M28 family peptidase [Chlorobi bacterium]|nr:M28 family peptidase [Chlorobiota bacterium]